MGLYDEIAIFWGIVVFIVCVSVYMVGYLCYRLGYRDGESDMAKRISRHAERQVQRGKIKRLR
jgi:hypothetical protein